MLSRRSRFWFKISWKKCYSGNYIHFLHKGHVQKLNMILGVSHRISNRFFRHFSWKMCPQELITDGDSDRVSTKQSGQNVSPVWSFNLSAFFYTHSSFKQGKHSTSPKTPPQGWSQGSLFRQAVLANSLHSFALHISSKISRFVFNFES